MTEDGPPPSSTATAPTAVTVVGYDETPEGEAEVDRWAEIARSTLVGEGITTGHLDLFLVGSDEMAALNAEHLDGSGPTDVLAFPLDGPEAAASPSPEPGPVHLGDIVVCPAVARAQAEAAGDYEAEMTLLVIHGALHVLGHDHAEPGETAAMRSRERHHLAALGLPHPVLDR